MVLRLGCLLFVLSAPNLGVASITFGSLVDLGPGAAFGLNDAGTVVGQDNNGAPFLWQSGVQSPIESQPGRALDINNTDTVVGWSLNNLFFPTPTRWDSGAANRFGAGSFGFGQANAVNDSGVIAGSSNDNQGAFVFFNGSFQNLGTLGGPTFTLAQDINNSGQVVGSAFTFRAENRPYVVMPEDSNNDGTPDLWFRDDNNDNINDLMTIIGNFDGVANAINSNGVVAGSMPGGNGFVWSAADGLTPLGTGTPLAINAAGAVAGRYRPSGQSDFRAFVNDGNGLTDLNDFVSPGSGWVLEAAHGINDQGWIIGEGTLNGAPRAFLLVPEPGGFLLLTLAGLLILRRP